MAPERASTALTRSCSPVPETRKEGQERSNCLLREFLHVFAPPRLAFGWLGVFVESRGWQSLWRKPEQAKRRLVGLTRAARLPY